MWQLLSDFELQAELKEKDSSLSPIIKDGSTTDGKIFLKSKGQRLFIQCKVSIFLWEDNYGISLEYSEYTLRSFSRLESHNMALWI